MVFKYRKMFVCFSLSHCRMLESIVGKKEKENGKEWIMMEEIQSNIKKIIRSIVERLCPETPRESALCFLLPGVIWCQVVREKNLYSNFKKLIQPRVWSPFFRWKSWSIMFVPGFKVNTLPPKFPRLICRWLCGYWELNMGPLQEIPVL